MQPHEPLPPYVYKITLDEHNAEIRRKKRAADVELLMQGALVFLVFLLLGLSFYFWFWLPIAESKGWSV
jgi:hypothetical protein